MKPSNFILNRLSHKFILGASLILLLMLCGSMFVNSQVAGRYYVYRQKQYIGRIGTRLEAELKSGAKPQDAVSRLEDSENVLIVYSDRLRNPDALSEELREAFRQKGLGFQKFWLWEQDYDTAVRQGSKFRLYHQDKLNYSILTEYLSIDGCLYAIAAIVPDTSNFIGIINRFGIILYSVSIFTAIILICFLVRRITKPLKQMESFTKNLSARKFEPLQIRTGDELEIVAGSLNQMGQDIQQYQTMLQLKNRQMKQLLSNVAHDLKTPVSLIGLYASGMRDGLDDGTFLDTVIRQNNRMAQTVENLLNLSRIEQKDHALSKIKLDRLLEDCIAEQRILFRERGLEFKKQIESDMDFTGSPELITELFSNLLSNAAKYASGGTVNVSLLRHEMQIVFRISNQFDNNNLDLAHIWEPFYVGENSRNETLSGTGLGLAIVKKIADQFGYTAQCGLEGRRIYFEIIFGKK